MIKGRRSVQSTQGPSLPGSSTSAEDEALLRGFKAREQPSQRQVGKLSAAKHEKGPFHTFNSTTRTPEHKEHQYQSPRC